MTYYVKMKLVKNNLCFGQSIVSYNFKSEIKTLTPQTTENLIKELLSKQNLYSDWELENMYYD